jgi:hypothetical protein
MFSTNPREFAATTLSSKVCEKVNKKAAPNDEYSVNWQPNGSQEEVVGDVSA